MKKVTKNFIFAPIFKNPQAIPGANNQPGWCMISYSFGLNCSSLDNQETKPFISSFTYLSDDNGSTMAANDNKSVKSSSDSELEKLQQMRNQEFKPLTRK